MSLLTAGLWLPVMAFSAQNPVEHTPTMGWSSWNTYHVDISDSLIMRQADACVSKGLKAAGYTYINIDDGFFGGRAADGRLLIHPVRFPRGLKPVVDHIHGLGLKAGIYSDAGANTCGCKYDNDTIARGVGLYGHDQQDADLFFRELGYDFIKVDFCGGSTTGNYDYLSLDPRERYTAIRQAIDNTGRKDVYLNVCRWDYPGTWVSGVAQSWRMSRDIRPRWSSVKDIIRQNLYLSAYAADGCYNDMDMLEVGRGMTEEEDRTHFGMWCMMASPLLIGCDLTTLKPATLQLLTNQELIAVNQDPLGLQAHVVKHDLKNGTYVLAKDLMERGGLTRAVALYNPTDREQTVQVSLADLELGGRVQAMDLYDGGGRSYALQSVLFTQTVPAHGCRIYRLTATERLPRMRYEAETSYLGSYQELYNAKAVGTAYYDEDSLCSGGMKVVNLGYRPDNDLQWRNVYCPEAGDYQLTIRCSAFPPDASLYVAANGGVGQYFQKAADGEVTLRLVLQAGLNTVRLYNDRGAMPEVDYMTIRPVSADGVMVAPYWGNRRAAVSYTFDDALLDQYTLARKELNRRDLRATFAVIGSKVGRDQKGTPCMTWAMLRQLAADGHEISNHGWAHRNVTTLSREALRDEVQQNDSIIFSETGHFPRTYVYPGNRKSDSAVAFCEQGRVGSRTSQVSIGSKRDARWLRQWVDSLIIKGTWGVGMTHGIAVGYDHFDNPQTLWQHFDYVSSLKDRLWVAPLCEVAAYVRERDNVWLSVEERENEWLVKPWTWLDVKLYSQPLTLVVTAGRIKSATQNGRRLKVYENNGLQMVDFLPDGGVIIIKKPRNK